MPRHTSPLRLADECLADREWMAAEPRVSQCVRRVASEVRSELDEVTALVDAATTHEEERAARRLLDDACGRQQERLPLMLIAHALRAADVEDAAYGPLARLDHLATGAHLTAHHPVLLGELSASPRGGRRW